MGGILDWLTEFLGLDLTGLANNLIGLVLSLFAVSLGFFSIHYLHRRRQMLHQERMATLIKGLHYAGVAREVFAKPPKADSRDHAMKGIRWLFGGLGLSGALYGYESLQPVIDSGEALRGAVVGIIPGAIGLAHLLCSLLCSRRNTREGSPSLYRAAGRRV
jgi:TRAP-type uncharacterized transport system fused permease subunit